MLETGGGVVEEATEVAGGVFVDEFDGDFLDAEVVGDGLDPELHGEGVAGDGEAEFLHGGDAVGLEAAEGVGELEVEDGVEEFGDEAVDVAAVRGGLVGGGVGEDVAGAGDDVGGVGSGEGVLDVADEVGDAGGFVLFVAVHGEDPVIMMGGGKVEGVDEGLAVAAVDGVGEGADIFDGAEELGGAVGGAVVDDEDGVAVLLDFGEDGDDVFFFIEDGNGDQEFHGAPRGKDGRIVEGQRGMSMEYR